MRAKDTYATPEKYREAKRRASKRYRDRTGSRMYRGHWTDEDYLAVMRHEGPDSELAPIIGHSVSAIQTARRRVRLGEVHVSGYDPAMDALAYLSKHGAAPEGNREQNENAPRTGEGDDI